MKRVNCSCVMVTIALTVGACASADPESGANVATPNVAEPTTITASPETRSKLGVAAWGLGIDEKADVFVRGYDDAGTAILTVQRTTTTNADGPSIIELEVVGSRGKAIMRQEVQSTPAADARVRVDFKVVRNTFADSADARSVLERLAADQTADAAHGANHPGGGALVSSLHPREIRLVTGVCADLSPVCQSALVINSLALFKAGASCGLTLAETSIALLCAAATSETGAGPAGCFAASAPTLVPAAKACVVDAATSIVLASSLKSQCTKKCAGK